ncbi:MAG: sodium:calcium antiporter [Candidatus Dojkabacteria bacterium]
MAALQIFIGMLVLVAASGLFVHSLVHIARILQIKEYLIVFLLLGVATALPELFIAASAAKADFPEIALGNALGTSIAAMSFVVGIIAVFGRKIDTKNFFQSRDLMHLSLSVVLLIILASDGVLSRLDGLLLLIVFVYYIWNLYSYKNHFNLKVKDSSKSIYLHLAVFIVSGAALYFAAEYAVSSTILMTQVTALPGFLIAVVLLAPLGIVPELIIELELQKSKLSNLTFGDLFTSVVVNTTLIIGLLAIFNPLVIASPLLLSFSGLVLIIILMLFNFFVRTKESLDWKEGLFLIIVYLFFIVSNFLVFMSS